MHTRDTSGNIRAKCVFMQNQWWPLNWRVRLLEQHRWRMLGSCPHSIKPSHYRHFTPSSSSTLWEATLCSIITPLKQFEQFSIQVPSSPPHQGESIIWLPVSASPSVIFNMWFNYNITWYHKSHLSICEVSQKPGKRFRLNLVQN